MDKLDYALKYAALGFPVFPLHTVMTNGICSCGHRDCKSVGKHPRTLNGVKDASTEPEQIRKWWASWPDANIGLATGSASGYAILDIDNDDNGECGSDSLLTWAHQKEYELPDTWQVLTGGGGVHFYFRTAEKIKNRAGVLPGVDVRGEGGYVVAPPSNHVSGHLYEWENSPDDMNALELPPEIRALMLSRADAEAPGGFTVPESVEEGARNATMFKLASSLKAKGLSDDAILAAVSAENVRRCSPPLDDRELETICRSVGRYQPGAALDKMQADAGAALALDTAAGGEASELTSEKTMQSLLAITDELERARKTADLRKRARELHCVRDFDQILKIYSEKVRRESAPADSAEHMTAFTDAPLQLACRGYETDNTGISGSDGQICSHPILPVSELTDVDSGLEKTEIAFRRAGPWKSVIADRSTLASRTAIISLADRGIAVNSENAKLLIQYLADMEAWNQKRIPRFRSVSNLGWVGSDFSPYMPDLKFSGEEAYHGLYDAVKTAGNRDAWLQSTAKVREESFIGRAALAASFTAPLIGMMNKLCFIVHIWGGTGYGKSVALMLAMSVWGNPAIGGDGLVTTFNATVVGMERLAGFFRSLPLALDELQCRTMGLRNDFETIVYMLCEGRGRSRGKKAGGLELVPWWRNCTISTGEQPLTEEMSGGGAKNRNIDIQCREAIFPDAPAVANCIQENYGWAGPEYIKGLQQRGVRQRAEELYSAFYKAIQESGAATDKQAMEAAMLAVGDYFSSVFVFGIEKHEAFRQAEAFLNGMKRYTLSNEDVDDTAHIYDWLIGWIASNTARFNAISPDYNEIWGVKQEGGGYWIIASRLQEAFRNAGISYRKALSGLADNGKIEAFTYSSKNKTEYTQCHKMCGANPRAVHVLPETEKPDPDGFIEIDPDEMPSFLK